MKILAENNLVLYLFCSLLSTVGIGCTQQHADKWIAHQEDFNSILSALNKDVIMESSVATFSLHDKSRNSRSRVQYVSVVMMFMCHLCIIHCYRKGYGKAVT